jgi:hypothetical protein
VTAPLVQRLSLVVDAATGAAEARMDAVASVTRDAGDAAERSAGQVAAAADRVAAAQLKRDDAAGRVTVAETRLLEVQERGNASASQLAAATERLESARRQLAVAENQVQAAQDASVATQSRATEATARQATESERARLGAERVRGQLDGLKDAAAGVTAFAVGDWLREQVSGYLEGARGAQALATSMNASVEEGGRLTTIFQSMGLEADDLLEIQAQFAQTSKDGLTAAGNELKTNRDGTVNWARSLEDALAQLQQIPDATERNRQGFQMFGEEGYKQLSRLLTSGVSVREAFERVGTPFTAEDVAKAQEFDRNMTQLSLAGSDLGRSLARDALPVLTILAKTVGSVADVVGSLPLPFTLAATAALVMGRTGWNPLTAAGELVRGKFLAVSEAIAAATATATVSTGPLAGAARALDVAGSGPAAGGLAETGGALTRVGEGAEGVATSAGRAGRSLDEAGASGERSGSRMASGMAVGRAGVTGLVNLAGGPLGVAMLALSAFYSAASDGEQQLEDHAKTAAAEVERLGGTSNDAAANTRRLAQQLDQSAGYWERVSSSARGLNDEMDEQGNWFTRLGTDLGLVHPQLAALAEGANANRFSQRGMADAIADARKELGEFGAQQAAAQLTQESLTQRIAEGDTSSQGFAAAVRDAAQAETTQSATSDTAAAAIAAYHAQTDQAVQAVRGLIDAQLAQQDANYAFLSAMDAVNSATDDAKTSVDEVAQAHTALQEAALRAGDAAADAAVAQAQAAGQIVTPLDEANVRATALIGDLTAKLNTPGLSKGAQADLQGLIDQLTTAQSKGDVNALVTLTGVDAATSQLDTTTADRDTQVHVESRGGPAVKDYLDGLAADRLAIIRTESRNGPAVKDYLDGLAAERLAIIRVETRNGPAVADYLNGLAGARRVAVIDVQTRGGAAAGAGGTGGGLLGAGSVSVGQLIVQPQVDAGGRLSAAAQQVTGRQVVSAIRDYERRNGPGWRT